ncbi:MAG: PspC domain-containing protein [Clostridia bacterium]|nr:PspC domain-containing protein [Clostridia bacterium]
MMTKKVYRSKGNRMIFGVCGGLAEFFSIDPTLVRLAAVLLCAIGGSGIVGYIIAAILMPEAV